MLKKPFLFVCLFVVLLLNAGHVMASAPSDVRVNSNAIDLNLNGLDEFAIVEKLSQTEQVDISFHLYKQLVALRVQSFREKGGDVYALASVIAIATTDSTKKQECIDSFGDDEKEIYSGYLELFQLADRLGMNAINGNITCDLLTELDERDIQTIEPCQLYYLQILELQETLDFPVHSTEFMVKEQVIALTTMFLLLENNIKAMQIEGIIHDSGDLTLDLKEIHFYWTRMVGLCHDLLDDLENRWGECQYNRKKILNLVFGKRFSRFFPYCYSEEIVDPIEQFLPHILKHADLKLARERFNQMNGDLESWDQNFEWVMLYKKAIDHLISTDLEKARLYYEKAQGLIDETFWCYFCSFHKEEWKEKKEEALGVIEDSALLFE